MATREKVLVGLAVLAIVYGVYVVFLSKPAQPTFQTSQKGLESLNAFITKVAEAAKGGLSEKDTYIIQKAEAQWIQDPLIRIQKPLPAETEPEEEVAPVKPELEINYTGYIEMDNVRLAIINGREYEAGDRLEQGGYIVHSISPTQVMIISSDKDKNRFIVPLQELQ